eukprot:g64749.t1
MPHSHHKGKRRRVSGSEKHQDSVVPPLYAALRVPPDATQAEIKKAYKQLALLHHPDKNPDRSEEARARFLEIVEAYHMLSDPAQRELYDLYGDAGVRGANMEGEGADATAAAMFFSKTPNNFKVSREAESWLQFFSQLGSAASPSSSFSWDKKESLTKITHEKHRATSHDRRNFMFCKGILKDRNQDVVDNPQVPVQELSSLINEMKRGGACSGCGSSDRNSRKEPSSHTELRPRFHVLIATAGTGKTLIAETLLAATGARLAVALASASSGIVSTLLQQEELHTEPTAYRSR